MSRSSSPRLLGGRDELEAMLERMAPVVLALLANGIPRSKWATVNALADRHDRQDLARTIMRLAITSRLVETKSRFTLPSDDAPPTASG